MAAAGVTVSIWGLPLESFRAAILIEMQKPCYEYNNSAVGTRHDIVGHDTRAGWEALELTDGRRFPDIEEPEQNEGRKPALPVQRDGAGDGDPLADHFVDDDKAGVLFTGQARHYAGR